MESTQHQEHTQSIESQDILSLAKNRIQKLKLMTTPKLVSYNRFVFFSGDGIHKPSLYDAFMDKWYTDEVCQIMNNKNGIYSITMRKEDGVGLSTLVFIDDNAKWGIQEIDPQQVRFTSVKEPIVLNGVYTLVLLNELGRIKASFSMDSCEIIPFQRRISLTKCELCLINVKKRRVIGCFPYGRLMEFNYTAPDILDIQALYLETVPGGLELKEMQTLITVQATADTLTETHTMINRHNRFSI